MSSPALTRNRSALKWVAVPAPTEEKFIDPGFALAYVEIARNWMTLGYSDPDGLAPVELLPHARGAVNKALKIDPELVEAHAVSARSVRL